MFGERLKEQRQEKGLSRDELGMMVGLKGRAIANYERGEREPTIETLLKLSEIFDCSLDYLLGKSKHRNAMLLTNNELNKFLHPDIKEKKIKVEIEKAEISEEMLEKIADIVYQKFVEKMTKKE